MSSSLHEECGVFGIYSPKRSDVVSLTYFALFALQHRGQESCGIAVNDDGVIKVHKDSGLVPEVFDHAALESLGLGNMAIGHTLYAPSGTGNRLNAQPLSVRHIKGAMAVSNNGTLTNYRALREELELGGAIFHSVSDAEVIAYSITKERLSAPSIEEAVNRAVSRLKGAYSLLIMSPQKLIAVRDPHGFRPLCIGRLGDSVVFASETSALNSIGASFERDVLPGEIVIVDENGMRSIRDHCGEKETLCVFEFVYFARPDSVIEGECVHEARKRAGTILAKEHPVDADVVIGVPDSGLDAALGYAEASNIPYGLGFIKNRYIGRTFIQPAQNIRENSVRIKLNVIKSTVAGKRVVLIDDSIVRGTTSNRIVHLLREAGATEVHMRLSSPPFINPCFYGTDIDGKDKLIACRMTIDEIAKHIGVDSLGYLSVEGVRQIAKTHSCGFCDACFTGNYPVEPPPDTSKNRFDFKISEQPK